MQTISLIISNLPIFKTLYELADDFWLNNVEACIQETRFLSHDWETMTNLMMREKYSEKIVFAATVKWVEHDWCLNANIWKNSLPVWFDCPSYQCHF